MCSIYFGLIHATHRHLLRVSPQEFDFMRGSCLDLILDTMHPLMMNEFNLTLDYSGAILELTLQIITYYSSVC